MGIVSTASSGENKSFSCKGKSGLHITTGTNMFIKLCLLSSQPQADEQKLGSGGLARVWASRARLNSCWVQWFGWIPDILKNFWGDSLIFTSFPKRPVSPIFGTITLGKRGFYLPTSKPASPQGVPSRESCLGSPSRISSLKPLLQFVITLPAQEHGKGMDFGVKHLDLDPTIATLHVCGLEQVFWPLRVLASSPVKWK